MTQIPPDASELVDHLPQQQQHLLACWDQLSAPQRQRLQAEIKSIDFGLMDRLFTDEDKQTDWSDLASRAQSPPAFRLNTKNRFSSSDAIAQGEQALAGGELGVILVAGGQGSRLGFEHPKGMYPIGPLSNRTLFQMHIEQLLAVAATYGVSIPLYLMTSPATHDETVEFLEQHDRFGLPDEDLKIFCQGTMPAVDATTGKLLLESPGKVFQSPDGHGGTLAALDKNGCLQDMQRRGIRHLFYFQVDNPLVELCQPELVGYHLLSASEMTTQVVGKLDPMEKVGNVVMVDDQMMVIEYSDLPAEQAGRRDDEDNPIFWAGSIAVHVFSVDFLKRAVSDEGSLPFHRALKKVSFLNEAGEQIEPSSPNAIKFEKFIFDLMPKARNPIVVEGAASKVFAPLKNASGAAKDTPEATRDAIAAKHKRLLTTAGAKIQDGTCVEVSPFFALNPTQAKSRLGDVTQIVEDRYFEI